MFRLTSQGELKTSSCDRPVRATTADNVFLNSHAGLKSLTMSQEKPGTLMSTKHNKEPQGINWE